MTGQHTAMLRAALTPAAALGATCTLAAGALYGWAGVAGAGLGAAVVLLVLGVGLAVMVLTAGWAPGRTMSAAVTAFLLSTVLVATLLVQARRSDSLSRPAFAVTAVLLTGAWVLGMARAHSSWARSATPPDFPASLMSSPSPADGAARRGDRDEAGGAPAGQGRVLGGGAPAGPGRVEAESRPLHPDAVADPRRLPDDDLPHEARP